MSKERNIISWWRTNFGQQEIEGITQAIREEHISQGKVTEKFEKSLAKLLDVPYVTATTSGSMSLLMALMSLDIKSGDEVIVPNRTWIATAHAPKLLGAKVIFVDVVSDIPIIDVAQLEAKITSKTKVIMPVPLNGRAVNMDEIWSIAKKHNLYVVEDGAQSLFCKYKGSKSDKFIGTESDLGCFSLSVAKLISTGQGGFVVTRNKENYEKLKRIRMHGVDDVVNCTFNQMGFNFRFTDLQASIGIAQLNRVNDRISYLKAIYKKYEQELKQFSFLKLIPVAIENGEIPIYIEVLCKEREKLVSFFVSQNIQVRPFYPNLNTADYFGVSDRFPNSEIFSRQGLVLPCGPDQSFENIDYVIKIMQSYASKK